MFNSGKLQKKFSRKGIFMAKFYKCARKHGNRKTRGKGFTLAELLIVVAIIAVLVAISIPIFTSQLHKARVATDWANLRAYYAEIQADFISTGEYNKKVPYEDNPNFKNLMKSLFKWVKVKITYFLGKWIQKKGNAIAYFLQQKMINAN